MNMFVISHTVYRQ